MLVRRRQQDSLISDQTLVCRSVRQQKAQSTLEYLIVIGLVASIMLAMGVYIQRTGKSLIKIVADQVGNQEEADQDASAEIGYMINSFSTGQADVVKTTRERVGVFNYEFNDRLATNGLTFTNLGITEDL